MRGKPARVQRRHEKNCIVCEQAWMGPGEEGLSMDSTRKSTMDEPDRDQEGHESKRLRLIGRHDGLRVRGLGHECEDNA